MERLEKYNSQLLKDIESFWKTIGIVFGIVGDNKIGELIENVRVGQVSLNQLQEMMIKEVKTGLPSSIIEYGFLVSPWQDNKDKEIKCLIDEYETKIDLLIDYIKFNEINKGWFRYLY